MKQWLSKKSKGIHAVRQELYDTEDSDSEIGEEMCGPNLQGDTR